MTDDSQFNDDARSGQNNYVRSCRSDDQHSGRAGQSNQGADGNAGSNDNSNIKSGAESRSDDPNSAESTANATWSRMLQGNSRFASGQAEHPWQDRETRESLIDGQHPDAAVLSCSDSRVPPEIIFDQGLGDMFTLRTAGQTLDDAVIASLEYAVTHLGVSILVVLGHQHCGAVASAVAELDALASGAGIDLGAAFAAEVTDSEMIDPAAADDAEDSWGSADSDNGPAPTGINHEAANDPADSDDSGFAARETARTGMDADDVFDKMEELVAASESVLVRSVGASVLAAQEAALSDTDDFERVHIARTIEALVDRSTVIQEALAAQRLSIVGARYQLTTGKVEVLSF